jgi:hypothetical protein
VDHGSKEVTVAESRHVQKVAEALKHVPVPRVRDRPMLAGTRLVEKGLSSAAISFKVDLAHGKTRKLIIRTDYEGRAGDEHLG